MNPNSVHNVRYENNSSTQGKLQRLNSKPNDVNRRKAITLNNSKIKTVFALQNCILFFHIESC